MIQSLLNDTYSKKDDKEAEQQGVLQQQQQSSSVRKISQDDEFNQNAQTRWKTPTKKSTTSKVAIWTQNVGSQTSGREHENYTYGSQEEFETDEDEYIKNDHKRNSRTRVEIENVSDAMKHCIERIQSQLQRAEDEHSDMNVPIGGDAHARKMILGLLPDKLIRELFLETIMQRKAWPRIRCLFGSPPYAFLLPEDANLLHAGGFSSGRALMAYSNPERGASYNQFGFAHFTDQHLREYRIMDSVESKLYRRLPYDISIYRSQTSIHLNVRIRKLSTKTRISFLKDSNKRQTVLMPQVGETLEVKYASGMQKVWHQAERDKNVVTSIVVKSVVRRSSNSSTAVIVGKIK